MSEIINHNLVGMNGICRAMNKEMLTKESQPASKPVKGAHHSIHTRNTNEEDKVEVDYTNFNILLKDISKISSKPKLSREDSIRLDDLVENLRDECKVIKRYVKNNTVNR